VLSEDKPIKQGRINPRKEKKKGEGDRHKGGSGDNKTPSQIVHCPTIMLGVAETSWIRKKRGGEVKGKRKRRGGGGRKELSSVKTQPGFSYSTSFLLSLKEC